MKADLGNLWAREASAPRLWCWINLWIAMAVLGAGTRMLAGDLVFKLSLPASFLNEAPPAKPLQT